MRFQQPWRRWRIWAFVIAGLIAPHAAQAAPKWIRLDADSFSILSDASPKEVEKFALDYAAFRQTLHDLVAPPGRRAPRPTILLFRTEKDFEKRVPKSDKPDVRMAAFTAEIDGDALLALPLAGDRRRALQLAFEFDTMWTLRRYGYFLPTWMSQGTGEVFSTLYLRKGQRVFGATDERFAGLTREGVMPWKKFFGIGRASPEYDGRKGRGQFHGQAWALMRWVLLQDENGRERFRRLAEELRRQPPDEAVATVMGVNDLQKEGSRYLRRNYEPRELPFDEEAVRASWTINPAPAAEVQVRLADLLAASGQTAAATWEIVQALNTAPNLPVVQEAAARRELRDHRPDLAIEHYRKAIEAGSTNPTAYLRSAADRLDRSRQGRFDVMGKGLSREIDAAITEIRRAIELDPGSGEAYRLLGRAFYVAPKLPEGAVEELSLGAGPGEEGVRVRLYRALVYTRLERNLEAREDLLALLNDGDAHENLRQEAARQLEFLEFEIAQGDIERLLKAREFEAARARLADAEASAQEPQVKKNYARLAQWLDQNEKKLRARDSANANPTVESGGAD
jgi:tetratricopeptide (TPR) repeat protein